MQTKYVWYTFQKAKQHSLWLSTNLFHHSRSSLMPPDGAVVKNVTVSAEDVSSIPRSRRSLAEGNVNPLQYSCLGNHMDRRAWWATLFDSCKKSQTWLSD